MKKPRPEYEALVPRIASGELTRKEAAEISSQQTGLSPGSFTVWLHNSGHAEKLKHTRLNTGPNNIHSLSNPDNVDGYDPAKVKAYEDALALAAIGKTSIRQAAAKFNVSYPYLLRKARAAGVTMAKEDKDREATLKALEKFKNTKIFTDENDQPFTLDGMDQLVSMDPDDKPSRNQNRVFMMGIMNDPEELDRAAAILRLAAFKQASGKLHPQ